MFAARDRRKQSAMRPFYPQHTTEQLPGWLTSPGTPGLPSYHPCIEVCKLAANRVAHTQIAIPGAPLLQVSVPFTASYQEHGTEAPAPAHQWKKAPVLSFSGHTSE